MRPGEPPPLQHLAKSVADALWATLPPLPAAQVLVERVEKALRKEPPRQAYELSRTLPRDLNLLMDVARNDHIPIEVRGKVLEVMLHRGATNDYSYDQMTGKYGDRIESLAEKWKHAARHDEFVERRRYQEAVHDAMFADPRLFDRLSMSKDQMLQGRSPATEFMNTMLRDGGLYGGYEARQEFERRMQELPAETRGRMMYHLLDAGHTAGIHQKGEKRSTGDGWELSVDTGNGGLGIGYSESWDYVDDNHWTEVGRDVTRQMREDLADRSKRSEEYVNDHEKGFNEAAARDRGFE
jgi:hypothetical protein